MSLNKKIENQNWFIRLTVSYLIVLIIPLVIGGFLYSEAVKVVKHSAIVNNSGILNQTMNIMDTRLAEVDAIAKQMAMSVTLNSLLNEERMEEGSPKYIKVWEHIYKNPNYKVTNKLIVDYMVFFKKSDIVISSTTAFVDTQSFYKNVYKDSSLSYDSFLAMIWDVHHQSAFLPGQSVTLTGGKKKEVIYYLQSIPIGLRGSLGTILIMLDKELILQLISSGLQIGDGGTAFIRDGDNHIIVEASFGVAGATSNEMQLASLKDNIFKTAAGEELYVSQVVSALNNWQYVSAIPAERLLSKVEYIKQVTLIVAVSTIILGILTIIYMAYRHSQPFRQLVNHMYQLINSNHSLERRLEEQLPLLRVSFLRRLLHGEFNNEQEIEMFLKRIHMPFTSELYSVIILRIEGYEDLSDSQLFEELEFKKITIKDTLTTTLINHSLFTYDMDANKIVIIIGFNQEAQTKWRSSVENIAGLAYERRPDGMQIRLSLSVGGLYDDISSVNRSFIEAKQALEYMRLGEHAVVFFEDIPREKDTYFYPIDLELRLIGNVKSGDSIEVKKIMDMIYVENFEKRKLSMPMFEIWINLMMGTITRIVEQTRENKSVTKLLEKIKHQDRIEDIFGSMKKAFMQLCDTIHEQKHAVKMERKDQLIAYLQSVYTQESLTLAQVAEHFEVSDVYMYQYIKDTLGVSFSDYIETSRINRACELLSQPDIAVKEVAMAIGYNSDHSFRRAFKRVMDILPTEYAKAVRQVES